MSRAILTRTGAWAAVLVLPVLLVAPPTGASARTSEQVRVIRVIDGDTIDVDSNRDGRIDSRIRLLGLDAPEHGLCGFTEAKLALARLVRHKVVQLRSDQGRTGIMNRPERRVVVPVGGGQKVDASTWMLERGWGVWMPRAGELTQSLEQHRAADRAAAAGRGWFSSNRCGIGPFSEDPLTMQVEYLADAAHRFSLNERRNQEFIRIRNDGPTPVDIDRWTLRVGNDRQARVPPGGPIAPGGVVDIHMASGTNTPTDRYLGNTEPMLVNASIDGGPHLGSGSYLIDPDDDIRAHLTWPCTYRCVDPTGGALRLSTVMVDPPGPDSVDLNAEYVTVTNQGIVPVRTGDFVLEVWPYVFEFPPGHVLAPGESVTVRAGDGQDSHDTLHLRATQPPLTNDGGRVLLRTYDAVVLDCFHWGTGHCPAAG